MARYTAKVALLKDAWTIIINRGSNAHVFTGDRVAIFTNSKVEVFDPDTNKSLGYLEVGKCTGTVTHVQEAIAHVRLDEAIPSLRTDLAAQMAAAAAVMSHLYGVPRSPEVEVGDFVRPISMAETPAAAPPLKLGHDAAI